MKRSGLRAVFFVLAMAFASLCAAQAPENLTVVPNLVSFSGRLADVTGKPVTSITGVTFLLYKDEQGGTPLWLETQNVTPDKSGHYSVQLGSTNAHGVPSDIFQSGEARWLATQIANEPEQPRTLLVAVPYAMKARDAETIGGLPPSAFVLAAPAAAPSTAASASATSSNAAAPTSSTVTTSGGTVNTLPLFSTATNIQNSAISQTGSGATAKIGINTATPGVTLDVHGTVAVRGPLTLPASGIATAVTGKNSQLEDFVASSFSSSTSKAVNQTFQLQAEPTGNDTATPSGTLNLLFGSGTAVPSETGLKISNAGQITFAAGQTFPGTGSGTVTSVAMTAPASDFTVEGSPVKSSGTLSLMWTVPPDNNATANAIVKRDNSAGFSAGNISAEAMSVVQGVTAHTLSATTATLTGGAAPTPVNATSSNPASPTILGQATSTTGAAWGVEGETFSNSSNAYGVVGLANSTGGSPIGTYGQVLNTGSDGAGVFGQYGLESTTGTSQTGGAPHTAPQVGVWGDGGSAAVSCISGIECTSAVGVLGTMDDGLAAAFVNNSSHGLNAVSIVSNNSLSQPLFVLGASGHCTVDAKGNLNCTGTKNAVVPVDGGARQVAMSAIESPQNWFEDAGEAELVNGAAVVQLDATYIQTVNTGEKYQVFLTPYGDCKGLYVTNRTASSFEVHELGGGTVRLSFGYRIMAIRRNYETVRFDDRTADMEKLERERARFSAAGVNRVSHDPGPTVRRGIAMGPAGR